MLPFSRSPKNLSSSNFSLYIHIPYCIKKCPYCDFNSYAVEEKNSPLMQEKEYTNALIKELELHLEKEDWALKTCDSIFFGGGTPSLFSEKSFEKILSAVRAKIKLSELCEITMEANPGTVQETLDREKLANLRKLGLNRISFGVQSFSEEKLKFLGRIHTTNDTLRAFENARAAGFENINLDLIFGLKNETLRTWLDDLEQALALAPEHISAYNLTIEPGTDFGRRFKAGEMLSAKDKISARMYGATQEVLKEHAYLQYEISNYAKRKFACAHNLNYWDRRVSYLGLGAGAHSFLTKTEKSAWGYRFSKLPGPKQYLEKLANNTLPIQLEEYLTKEQAKLEFFLLGLRTKSGVSESAYQELFAESLLKCYASSITELTTAGLLEREKDRIFLTQKGFLFANTVYERFAQVIH